MATLIIVDSYYIDFKRQHFLKFPRNEPYNSHFLSLETKNPCFDLIVYATSLDIGNIIIIYFASNMLDFDKKPDSFVTFFNENIVKIDNSHPNKRTPKQQFHPIFGGHYLDSPEYFKYRCHKP